jgi:hypothetical protein
MRRLALSLLLPLLTLLLFAPAADAGESWCFADPIVQLNGTRVRIEVAIPAQYQPLVDGAISVEVKTPPGTARDLLATDAGFNGHGEEVRFTDLDSDDENAAKLFTTKITVRVPLDKSQLTSGTGIPAQVVITPENAAPVVTWGTSDDTTATLAIKSTKTKKGR